MDKISVLQWNILADHLSGSSPTLGGFDNITAEMLDWSSRKDKIIKTIKQYNPTFIALQECDHFDELADELSHYTGYFAMKPASAPEGICLFISNAYTINVIKCVTFTYTDPDGRPSNQPAIIIHVNMFSEVDIIIATTHLKATKTATGEAIRKHQMDQLLAQIRKMRPNPTTPVILLGDLNAMPEDDPEIGPPLTYNAIIASDLGLKPAHDVTLPTTVKSRGGRTTARCIDYIMYAGTTPRYTNYGLNLKTTEFIINNAPDCSEPVRLVSYVEGYKVTRLMPPLIAGGGYGPPSKEPTLKALGLEAPMPPALDCLMPNETWPSDHTCLYAEFTLGQTYFIG